MANDPLLLKKLDRFIRKYYRNRLIKGLMMFAALTGAYYLTIVLLEYYFYFNPLIRGLLLFSFIGITGFILVRFIFIPLFQLLKIGPIISYEQAAVIIGSHFNEIRDKLLNTLQLLEMRREAGDSPLLEASIDQKINTLKVFSFSSAINLKKNLKYLKYVVFPVIILLAVSILSPGSITDPTRRIVQFNRHFEKPLPFQVTILNSSMQVMQQENYELKIKVTGEEIPVEFFVQTTDARFKMEKDNGFRFSYLFRSVPSDLTFRIAAGDYLSEPYQLTVRPKPIILNFELMIEFPSYIKKPREKVENTGDVTVPEGTRIDWRVFTKDATDVTIRFDSVKKPFEKQSGNRYVYSKTISKTASYAILPGNIYAPAGDSLAYKITAIPDGYPSITVTSEKDPLLQTNLFFSGTVKDDYGFSTLSFFYRIESTEKGNDTLFKQEKIDINPALVTQNFYYPVDLFKLSGQSGLSISYFFEVRDNDAIHGPKATRTALQSMKTPSREEIEEKTEKSSKAIENNLTESKQETGKIENTLEELNRRLTEKSTVSWQEKKKIEEMIKSQENLMQNLETVNQKNKENIINEEKYLNTSERILEKQKRLSELMEQLMTEEMKKMAEEMKKLLEATDKLQLQAMMEKIEMNNQALEQQLDRNLELFKQIEFERKVEEMADALKRKAEEEKNLADLAEKEKNKTSGSETEKEQKKVKEALDSLNKKMDQLAEEGKKTENAPDLKEAGKKMDSLQQRMEQIDRQLSGNQKKKASENMNKAAKEMEEMAESLESALEQNEEEQLEEDVQNLRRILENLVRSSFEQERLMGETKIIARNDPRYPSLVEKQKELSDKIRIVEDSLRQLAKRQIMLEPVIAKEIAGIEKNINQAVNSMSGRLINNALTQQQLSMTSMNNLALLLNESLNQMNQQMSMSMMGKGKKSSCQKSASPKGKGSMKNMKSLQQKMGEDLQKLKEGMEQSKSPGKSDKKGQSEISKQIAKLAAEQEAIRNELQKYRDALTEQGIKDGGSLKETIRAMEQNETDLINKQITQETIKRQQTIMTRMLESEKAEQQREKEEKRESNEAKNQLYSNPLNDFKYKSKERSDIESLQLSLPVLNNFYKNKVNHYVLKIAN